MRKIFKSEIPEDFARELRKCKTDEAAAEVATGVAESMSEQSCSSIQSFTQSSRLL